MPRAVAKLLKRTFLKNKRISWLSEDWMQVNQVKDSGSIKRNLNSKYPLHSHLKSNLCDFGIPHLLRYEDRNSMRWSIESRVPFLHVDLVEYLYSLPEEFLLNDDATSKYVFREAMRGIVPDPILDRMDKIGFATPEKDWLTSMDVWVNKQIESSRKMPVFNHDELKIEWKKVLTGETAFDFRCWRWLNLITWLNNNEK
jgi:asparagine synthase (glutamine-hydrolysing)